MIVKILAAAFSLGMESPGSRQVSRRVVELESDSCRLKLTPHMLTVHGNPDLQVTILEGDLETQGKLVSIALDDSVPHHAPDADPYGAVLWPAAMPVAEIVVGLIQDGSVGRVFELGCGTGLVSLAATVAGASNVIATDYNPVTLSILDAAIGHNFEKDEKLRSRLSTTVYDVSDPFCPQWSDDNFNGGARDAHGACDLVVCADMLYSPQTSRAVARLCAKACRSGWRALVGDTGRPGASAFIDELELLGLVPRGKGMAAFKPVEARTIKGPRNSLIATQHEHEASISVGIIELFPIEPLMP